MIITTLLRCPSCSSGRRPRGRLEGVLRAVLQRRKTVAKPKQPEEQRLLRISSLSELTKHVISALNFVSVVAAIKIKQDAIKLDQGCSRCAFKTETTGYSTREKWWSTYSHIIRAHEILHRRKTLKTEQLIASLSSSSNCFHHRRYERLRK